jgi:hypothetical protein
MAWQVRSPDREIVRVLVAAAAGQAVSALLPEQW